MVIRIRFKRTPRASRKRQAKRRLALVVAALLPPLALTAAILGLWRVASDLKLAASFAIPSGIFSHWQVWVGAAILLKACAFALNRYAKSDDPSAR
jgi:hypothetical protein